MVGLEIGLAVAAVGYATGHGMVAALSATGTAAAAMAVQAGLRVRKMVRRLAAA